MSQESVLFWILSLFTLGSGVAVVRSRNLVHAAFWLMPCFFAVACLFLLLGNELLFTIQLLIYAGAIPITVLFVLMLTQEVMNPRRREVNSLGVLAAASSIFFVLLGWIGARSVEAVTSLRDVPPELTKDVGRGFLTNYLLPFEVASLLLLGALVGAVYLSRADLKPNSSIVGLARRKLKKEEEEGDADDSAAKLDDDRSALV